MNCFIVVTNPDSMDQLIQKVYTNFDKASDARRALQEQGIPTTIMRRELIQ